jgi:hypothetical protein
MSPEDKVKLQQIADRLYGEIEKVRAIATRSWPCESMLEYRALLSMRDNMQATADKIEEVLYDAHTASMHTPDPNPCVDSGLLNPPDYTPHEQKTCQACAHGCCAMTSDVT